MSEITDTVSYTYIQRLGQGQRETVDCLITRKEARKILSEYQMSDPSARYYLSQRPCKGFWP